MNREVVQRMQWIGALEKNLKVQSKGDGGNVLASNDYKARLKGKSSYVFVANYQKAGLVFQFQGSRPLRYSTSVQGAPAPICHLATFNLCSNACFLNKTYTRVRVVSYLRTNISLFLALLKYLPLYLVPEWKYNILYHLLATLACAVEQKIGIVDQFALFPCA